MKENYWVRGELDNENFRHDDLKQQDKRHSLNHHDRGQVNGHKQQHWHKKNRTKSLVEQTTTNNANTTTTKNNHNADNLILDDTNNENCAHILDDKTLAGEIITSCDKELPPGDDELLEDGVSVPLEYRERLHVGVGQQLAKKEENGVNLSFCGCGFLGIYHVGVASCFHQYAPQLSMHKIAGSSAGALVAVAHICGNLQLAYATTDILRVAIDARARALGPLHPSFDINATVREALERGLPDDVHVRASGKLHISLTRVYDGENVIVSEFESKEDVIQALLCSCFIPFWSGLITPKYKGISYMDGGFSKNLLILDDKTVTVSPFAGETDICPQDDSLSLLQVSLSNTSFSLTPNNLYRLSHALLPPPPEILSDLCEQGFADGIRFLQQMKLISCTKCLEIRSSLLVTVNGEDMEEAFTQQVNSNESIKSISSLGENDHIRLEQQEQKMIEINGGQRRNSVVSTTSQIYHQQTDRLNASASPSSAPTCSTSASAATSTTLHYKHETRGNNRFSSSNPSNGMENCNECYLMRQKALREPLPTQFSDRIRDACDAVNKSLSNWFYSYRPIKYLSYLAAPYYLPIDISLALIVKCWQQLPYIRSDLINCVSNIVNFLLGILKRMHLRSTSRLLMERGSSWDEEAEQCAIEYEKEIMRLQMKSSNNKDGNNNEGETNNASSVPCCCPADSNSCRHRNSHQDGCITTNLQPTTTTTTTTTAASGTDESSLSISKRYSQDSGEVYPTKSRKTSQAKPELHSNSPTHHQHHQGHSHHHQLHSLEDTFDSIVDVTSNQEARIFAYYFRDAKNRLQVTEIFDLERAAELTSNNHL